MCDGLGLGLGLGLESSERRAWRFHSDVRVSIWVTSTYLPYGFKIDFGLCMKICRNLWKTRKLCKLGLNRLLRMRATEAVCIRVASAVRDPGRSLVGSKVE